MLTSSYFKDSLLEEMGITQWRSKTSLLHSHLPIFYADCLVLLPQPIHQLTIAQQKILTGMLSLLPLSLDSMAFVWIKPSLAAKDEIKKNKLLIIDELIRYAPQHILILGKTLSHIFFNTEKSFDELRETLKYFPEIKTDLTLTYHPEELETFPADKKKAYQDLLQLKETLETKLETKLERKNVIVHSSQPNHSREVECGKTIMKNKEAVT